MYCDRDSCLPLRHLCEGTSPREGGSPSRRHHGAFKPTPGPQTPEPTALDARLHGHDGRCCHPRIFLVTPAKTGVHPAGTTGLSNLCQGRKLRSRLLWMPVCTGMTVDIVTPAKAGVHCMVHRMSEYPVVYRVDSGSWAGMTMLTVTSVQPGSRDPASG